MPELKACPFCGGKVRFSYNIEFGIDGIFCPKCHYLMKYTNIEEKPKDTAGQIAERWAERWNRRAEGLEKV